MLGVRMLSPMLLTISLKTCSRQHLNYFKTLPSFFNTHQLSCFKSLTRMWKPQCQNNCCSLLGFWQATFNLKPSKNGYFYLFFFLNSEVTILTVFLSLVLTGWKWVQEMHEAEYGNTVWCSRNGSTCQRAYHKEVVNGCDFPNSGLGRRQNAL